MRVASNGNGNEVECTECNPPRRFKSKSGLNGHTQFKHGHLTDNRAVLPNGKQSQMYEDLTERVERGFDLVIDRLDTLANRNGNGQGNGNGNGQGNWNGNGQGNGNGNGQGNGNGNGQGNGNGNGLANGNGYNTEPIGVVSPPKDEPIYHCDDCGFKPLVPSQPRCPGCRREQDWNGVADPLNLNKSEL